MGVVVLRAATPVDAELLRAWDDDPDVIASGVDDDWGWENELPRVVPWREMLIAEVDGRPVGFVQLIDAAEEESHYWGDAEPGAWAIDIWIGAAEHRNRGSGSEMMRQSLHRCFALHGADVVLIDPLASNTRAHRFYERLGFRAVGERRFGDDLCLVHELSRDEWVAAQSS
jgi:aminoglycoside 6'-N-acetyltransferase